MNKAPLATTLAALAALSPSAASAATLRTGTAPDGHPGALYRASLHEVNKVRMHAGTGPFGSLLPFEEFAAPIRFGAGCTAGTPFLCGSPSQAYDADVRLGDRNDVADVNSFLSDVFVSGGDGADDFLAGGHNAQANGDDGDDTVRVAGDGAVTASGGDGDDAIAGGLGAFTETLSGDGGDDLLVPAAPSGRASGGWGEDAIVAGGGRSVSQSGDGGDDVLVVSVALPGAATLDGGRDDDVIDTSATGGATIAGGSGNDRIDAAGGDPSGRPDTIACGSGFDRVWADPEDTVAADCELRLAGPAPDLPGVAAALSAAQALRAHTPDPSA